MKRSIIILLAMCMLSTVSFAHTNLEKITGRVTDAQDGSPLPGVNVVVKGTTTGTITGIDGKFELEVTDAPAAVLVFSYVGMKTQEVRLQGRSVLDVKMEADVTQLQEVVRVKRSLFKKQEEVSMSEDADYSQALQGRVAGVTISNGHPRIPESNEEYLAIEQWGFKGVADKPLSTFSIDVDAASYANVRRYLNNGQRPPADAVRIEEMINYFSYDYAQPRGTDPFSITTEVAPAPWNSKHKLVHIGLQGKRIPTEDLPPSNLVFLLDVSGSMSDPSKLPLLKKAFRMLVGELRDEDRISIVVYAGAAGVVLEPTAGNEKEKIIEALDNLQAGGSTAGGAGIQLAYALAEKEFKKDGNNRIILATDGDFNVGVSSTDDLERLITEKRESGIYLTVLGFGTGNIKDNKMETLADKGNGNYAYIDNIQEARKVFVNEFGGTLFTIAKDVKIQVEFNPVNVQAYRLIGYENRALNDEDFNNDRKDAGELGSGHTVTALYEVIPAGVKSDFFSIDPLKYQKPAGNPSSEYSDELLTVKLRYKLPDENRSRLITRTVKDTHEDRPTENFRWSAAVASFGMWLRDSEYLNGYSIGDVAELAQGAKGMDPEGYRSELVRLIKSQENL